MVRGTLPIFEEIDHWNTIQEEWEYKVLLYTENDQILTVNISSQI